MTKKTLYNSREWGTHHVTTLASHLVAGHIELEGEVITKVQGPSQPVRDGPATVPIIGVVPEDASVGHPIGHPIYVNSVNRVNRVNCVNCVYCINYETSLWQGGQPWTGVDRT